jgi:hypothetical protein
MKSRIEVGLRTYQRATKRATPPALFDSFNDRPLQTRTDDEISAWLADGGACLRIIPVRRFTGHVPHTFRVFIDRVPFIITNPSQSVALLDAGEHLVASLTRSPLGRYTAVLHLAAGEDVELRFRSGLIAVQEGGGWGALTTHKSAAN